MNRTAVISQNGLQSISRISPWHGRAVRGCPVHTLVRGRFVMREGRLVSEATGWGRSVKERQQMPPARPRNTELSTAAILTTPPGVPPNALPVPEAQR
jgi:dihydroorotase